MIYEEKQIAGYMTKMAIEIAVSSFFMGSPFMGSGGRRSKVQGSEDSNVRSSRVQRFMFRVPNSALYEKSGRGS